MPVRKRPKTEAPDTLNSEDMAEVFKWGMNHKNPRIQALFIRRGDGSTAAYALMEKCLNTKGGDDERHCNWGRVVKTWIGNHVEWNYDLKPSQREKPQYDLGKRGSGNVISIRSVMKGEIE